MQNYIKLTMQQIVEARNFDEKIRGRDYSKSVLVVGVCDGESKQDGFVITGVTYDVGGISVCALQSAWRRLRCLQLAKEILAESDDKVKRANAEYLESLAVHDNTPNCSVELPRMCSCPL